MSAVGRSRRTLLGLALLCLAVPALAGCRGGHDDRAARREDVAPTVSGPPADVSLPVFPEPPAALEGGAPPTAAEESIAEPAEPALPSPSVGAQLTRLVIPKAKVDHRFVVRGLTPRREMEDPGGKDDVAWYNFSALPGFGSNAVLSGHVDWYTGQPGVFWYLRDVQEGDDVEVYYSDGLVLKYRVSRIAVYGADDAPVAEITAPTPTDTLTMITCDGVFSKSSHDYNKRRVVIAERVA